VSVVNYLLVRTLFRLPVHDFQNVTVYPSRLVQSFTLESDSAFTNPECLLKAWWAKGPPSGSSRSRFSSARRG
jgi:hypothetical protein